MSKAGIENRLAQIRKSRGLAAAELARRVNVNRQTIYAIEAGTYVPNTEVALHLARELEVAIDDLFSLRAAAATVPELLTAEVLSAAPPAAGQPVRICQVGTKWVSVPVSATPSYLPEADGVIRRTSRTGSRADLVVVAKEDAAHKRLVLAGCDPAARLLANMVERVAGIEIISAAASSKLALAWLKEGQVHIAGSHLEDPATGEFNVPFVREMFAGEEMILVTFANWEEGFAVASGNPKQIRAAADLAKRNVRLINRERGAAIRTLLDRLLAEAGLAPSSIRGYHSEAFGHLAAAYAVADGQADVCLVTRSAALTFGLDFLPLHHARYDFVLRKRTLDLPAAKAFLDVLQRATLRRKLELLAGYDTSQTGTVIHC
ncbi:MAG: helix-turn-helix domain-containing protein [Acidobacteria bacterium]|nr:helix-turn-helix domain-containing protein [Acidobacteriota bacterium]